MSTALSMTLAHQPYALNGNDFLMQDDHRYVLRLRDLPSHDRPREKLLQFGPGHLNAPELLAIILGVGTKKEELLEMTRRIVKEYGEKAIISEHSPEYLAQALDIPVGKACQIVASFELGRRYFGKRAGKPLFVRTARQAYQHFKDMGSFRKEQLRGIYLNSRYQVVHEETISMGSLTANIVHPREVFQPALEHGAVAVILAHNHPSGSLEPTEADQLVTAQLVKAGKLLSIDVLDHLIVTETKYISLAEVIDEKPEL